MSTTEPTAESFVDKFSSSLEKRMAGRREQLELATSEVFPVPGYDQMTAVKLRLVGYRELRKIAKRHERQHDEALQELYTAADQIIAATEGFYDLDDFGGDLPRPDEDGEWPETLDPDHVNWLRLARAALKGKLGAEVTMRQALIRLIGDQTLVYFWNAWTEWMNKRRPQVDREVAGDFRETP